MLDGCKRFASYYNKEKFKLKVAKWRTPKKKKELDSDQIDYSLIR